MTLLTAKELNKQNPRQSVDYYLRIADNTIRHYSKKSNYVMLSVEPFNKWARYLIAMQNIEYNKNKRWYYPAYHEPVNYQLESYDYDNMKEWLHSMESRGFTVVPMTFLEFEYKIKITWN